MDLYDWLTFINFLFIHQPASQLTYPQTSISLLQIVVAKYYRPQFLEFGPLLKRRLLESMEHPKRKSCITGNGKRFVSSQKWLVGSHCNYKQEIFVCHYFVIFWYLLFIGRNIAFGKVFGGLYFLEHTSRLHPLIFITYL